MKANESLSTCFTLDDDVEQSFRSGAKTSACTANNELAACKTDTDILSTRRISLIKSTKLKTASHINIVLRNNDRNLSMAIVGKCISEPRHTHCYSIARGLG